MAQKSPLEMFVGVVTEMLTPKPTGGGVSNRNEKAEDGNTVPRRVYDELRQDRDRMKRRYDALTTRHSASRREIEQLRSSLDAARSATSEKLGYDGMTDPAFAQPDASEPLISTLKTEDDPAKTGSFAKPGEGGGTPGSWPMTPENAVKGLRDYITMIEEQQAADVAEIKNLRERCLESGEMIALMETVAPEARRQDEKIWHLVGLTDGLKVKARTTNGEETVFIAMDWFKLELVA